MKLLILIALSLFGLGNAVNVKIPGLGEVKGVVNTTAWTKRKNYQFMGIKFAMPPSGKRRFMPPEPIKPWKGVYDATKLGIACPQMLGAYQKGTPTDVDIEDCLTLNVFTPKLPENNSKLLPVMVFIYGGAFVAGSAHPYLPDYILERDVVLVTIAYRVGTLGFLSLGTDGIPGNAGLVDQLEALRWINKHIKSFGGDNTQVTIFGESAGAGSVTYHLLSPLVEKKLFQRVIIQSGSAYANWGFDKDPLIAARGIYQHLMNSNETADLATMEKKFKEVSVKELFDAAMKNKVLNGLAARAVAQTAGTAKFFTKSPIEYLNSGEFRTVPMISGVVKHEGTFRTTELYNNLKAVGLENDDDFLRNNLTKMALEMQLIEINEDTDSVIDILNMILFKHLFENPKNVTFRDVAPGITDVISVFLMKGQVLKQAKANSKYSNNETFFFTFDYRGEHSNFGFGVDPHLFPFDGGVAHSDDLIYLFPLYKLNAADTKMAELMVDLWTSFAAGKKPTSPHLDFEWESLNIRENGPYLHLNLPPYLDTHFVSNEFPAMSKEQIDLEEQHIDP